MACHTWSLEKTEPEKEKRKEITRKEKQTRKIIEKGVQKQDKRKNKEQYTSTEATRSMFVVLSVPKL